MCVISTPVFAYQMFKKDKGDKVTQSDVDAAREEVLREDPFSAVLKSKRREEKTGSAFNDAWQV